MKIIEYDTERYCFSSLITDLYGVPLEVLDSEDKKTNLSLGKDTHTSLHKVFYERLDSKEGWPEFEDLYRLFVSEALFPLFSEEATSLVYQSVPGIRFNRPGAKAVYSWHSDGDKNHKHPLGEINIYLPLTDSYDTNTIWVESIPGLGDFHPVNLEYGQFLMGYLNQCRHGNKINKTGKTRVSLDFRIIPDFAYDETYEATTCTTKKLFKVGNYYSKMER